MRLQAAIIEFLGFFIQRMIAHGSADGQSPDRHVKSLLIVRLDGVGDMVMMTGFFEPLRALYPGARIELVMRKEWYDFVAACPYIDRVHVLSGDCHPMLRPIVLMSRAIRLGLQLAKDGSWDIAFNPRWDVDGNYASAVICLSRATRRIGFSEHVNVRKHYFNAGFDRLYSEVLNDRAPRHEIERTVEVLLRLGGEASTYPPNLWLTREDQEYAARVLETVSASKYIAIAPGAGRWKRMWPTPRFAGIANELLEQHRATVVILGSKSEREICESLRLSVRGTAINLAGQTSLRQAAAILSRCAIFVGNDSGLLHLAAAAGTASVGISCHPTCGLAMDANSPLRFKPWGNRAFVIQPAEPEYPCIYRCESDGPHCILNVTVEQVVEAIRDIELQLRT